jgi:hypothetical protein
MDLQGSAMSELTKQAAEFIKQAKNPSYLQAAEKIIGRPLEDYEAVIFRDGNKENVTAENIMVGFKAGVPYQYLQCSICKNRLFTIQTEPSEVQSDLA